MLPTRGAEGKPHGRFSRAQFAKFLPGDCPRGRIASPRAGRNEAMSAQHSGVSPRRSPRTRNENTVRPLRPVLSILAVVALVLAGSQLREALGIELSPQSLRGQVAELGVYGPLIFLVLMAMRAFLMLPSSILLSAGGLLFGVGGGTILGSVGVVLSAEVLFGMTRGMRSGLRTRPALGVSGEGEDVGSVAERIARNGPVVIALVTAHPFAPMSIFHTAAGATSISSASFFVAVAAAAPLRAFGYSFFGMTLANIGSFEFYAATTVLVALIAVPLAYPPTRKRLLG